MAFRWKGPEAVPRGPEPPASARARVLEPEGQPCPALAHVLDRILKEREDRPEVLDQGSLSGRTPVFLAERGARVHVDEFEPPPPAPRPPPGAGGPPPEGPPLRIDHPDASFDLVLSWELFDFTPPDRLCDYGAEVRRILRQGGYLLLFSHAKPEKEADLPPRYRILADGKVLREPSGRPSRRRWVHPNRDLERALSGFSIQKMHLQRNQMREIVAMRTGR